MMYNMFAVEKPLQPGVDLLRCIKEVQWLYAIVIGLDGSAFTACLAHSPA